MIESFLEQLREGAYDRANDEGNSDLRLTALLEEVLERLDEAGILSDAHSAFFQKAGRNLNAEVHGYCIDAEDDVLMLFYLIDANHTAAFDSHWSPEPVGKDAVDRGFRRLESFVKLVEADRADDTEESLPAAELVALVREAKTDGRRVSYSVIATGELSDRAIVADSRAGAAEVWDLVRLFRVCGGMGDEAVSIDFSADFNCTLPCLTTSPSPDGIRSRDG
jgi:hypothetical protein